MSDRKIEVTKTTLWDWVKATCTLCVVGVLSYKVYLTPINLTVDFPTLLSLLLALFSVGLAALFYFKATETSNTFYDNTNNFTKNIAQLLAKMESGFGEKLRNLDEGYTSVRDHLQNNYSSTQTIDETKEKIKDEKQEIQKVLDERNQILEKLLDKAQLEKQEKEDIAFQLKEKEEELKLSQNELTKMNKRLFVDRMRNKENRELSKGFINYTRRKVVDELTAEVVLSSSEAHLRRRINELINGLPRGYVDDLERKGFFDEGINAEGIECIVDIAKKYA